MNETRPAFRFYAKDWLASTRGLSGAARGYHIDMLALSWLNGGCDTDPDTLRRSVGAERAEWRKVWPELAPRWQEVNGRLVNRRLETVREEATAYSDARREAGKRGGRPKANGKQNESKPEANKEAKHNPSFAVAFAVPTSSIDDDTERASWTNGQLQHVALDLLESWRQHGTGGRPLADESLDPKEKRDVCDALRRRSLTEWESVFRRAKASDYLSGRDGQFPPMSLPRVLASANGIMAGEHDNRRPKPTRVAGLTGGGVPANQPRSGVHVIDPDYNGAEYRFHCGHTPTCTTWPQCRDREAVAS